MMIVEIVGGTLYGSLALVADGLHMSTHAGAMLIAALAYTYARRHADDSRFVFGTGKLGDLAGFSSAIVLAMIALLIGYEAVARFLAPVPIHFTEAIPIAVVGLLVNIVSAWLLSGGDHPGHHHGPESEHDHRGRDAGNRDPARSRRAIHFRARRTAAISGEIRRAAGGRRRSRAASGNPEKGRNPSVVSPCPARRLLGIDRDHSGTP